MASAVALSLNHVLNSRSLLIASVPANPFIVSKVYTFPSSLSQKSSTTYDLKPKHPPIARASAEGLLTLLILICILIFHGIL